LVYNYYKNKLLNLEGLDMEMEKDKLYDIFLNCSYSDLKKLFKNAKTKEEQDFYMTLSNIVLQKQQERVIGR